MSNRPEFGAIWLFGLLWGEILKISEFWCFAGARVTGCHIRLRSNKLSNCFRRHHIRLVCCFRIHNPPMLVCCAVPQKRGFTDCFRQVNSAASGDRIGTGAQSPEGREKYAHRGHRGRSTGQIGANCRGVFGNPKRTPVSHAIATHSRYIGTHRDRSP